MKPSFDAAIDFARDLIRIPSLPGEEGELARRVVEEMEVLRYDEAYIDELGNVVGMVWGGDGPTVMLSAHLDMVAAGDPDEWEYPPFAGVIADGFLHGRGAMDIKGPLALQTHVAAALAGQTAGDVVVAHPVFEERGGWGMDYLTRAGSERPLPDVVIIGESTGGDIAIGHRGRAEIEVVMHGLAGHASAPERAHNALDMLPAVLAGVADLAQSQESDPVLGQASVVTTGVSATPASLNVIPDLAIVTLDWRILPSDSEATLISRVEDALLPHITASDVDGRLRIEVRVATERQRAYTGVEEMRRVISPGFLMEADDPIVLAAARAVGSRRSPDEPARVRPWTFATDGGWTKGVRGVPTIGFAPGEERHAHTNTERLALDEARWAYGKYLEVVPAVQAAIVGGR